MKPEFRIRIFATPNHRRENRTGHLLLEVGVVTESSAHAEVEATKNRMRRGEVSHLELIDLRPGGTLTDLHVHAETKIPWSWTKR